MDCGLLGDSIPDGIGFEALFEVLGEGFVQFDEIESVVLSNVLNDGASDSSRARSDFEDSDWWAVGRTGSQIADHGPRQEPTAGSDGAGRFEAFPKLTEERGVLFE